MRAFALIALLLTPAAALAQPEGAGSAAGVIWMDSLRQDLGLMPENVRAAYASVDFTPLFTHTPPSHTLGVIGDANQRLHIALIHVVRRRCTGLPRRITHS